MSPANLRALVTALVLAWHSDELTSPEIARRASALMSRVSARSRRGVNAEWTTRRVVRFLIRRGLIPNEAWSEAEDEDFERDRAARLAAARLRLAIEDQRRQLSRSRAALKSLSNRLESSIHKARRTAQSEASRANREARQAKRAERRATLDPATVAKEIAKAAKARSALRARGDAYLREAGPLILAMREHCGFDEIAAALKARGVRTAKGGPWTHHAAKSVLDRITARTAEGDGFYVKPEAWKPPPPAMPPPGPRLPTVEELREAAFKAADAKWRADRQAAMEAQQAAYAKAASEREAVQVAKQQAKLSAKLARQAGKTPARVRADEIRSSRASAAARAKAAAVRAAALAVVDEIGRGQTLVDLAKELTRRGVERAHGGSMWTKGAVGALLRSR